MNQTTDAPFAIAASPQMAELLYRLKCTVTLSTYQAGKLIFLSAVNDNSLVQLPRNFKKPMGIALHKDKLALATAEEVTVFNSSPDLARSYPIAPDTYDELYLPRTTYHTGAIDLHDLEFGTDAIFAVNTLFSSIVKIDDNFSFTPWWTPPFISKADADDRCHLNGMAMLDGKPKYATAFSTTDAPRGWRERITETGVLMDVEKNEILIEGLAMPHSPRIYRNELYVLQSATGELVKVNTATRSIEVIKKFQGFVRGLDFIADYAFISFSKLRKKSSTFSHLPFAEMADRAGFVILHLPTKAIVAEAWYKTSVDEIYDLRIMPHCMRPNILSLEKPESRRALHLPHTTYWRKENPDDKPK